MNLSLHKFYTGIKSERSITY